MQKQDVKKQEVEELLGFAITDEQLREALECARRKQEYIYQAEFFNMVKRTMKMAINMQNMGKRALGRLSGRLLRKTISGHDLANKSMTIWRKIYGQFLCID